MKNLSEFMNKVDIILIYCEPNEVSHGNPNKSKKSAINRVNLKLNFINLDLSIFINKKIKYD